jgi:CubicO group peptidase (beta-lactamase class C family)
MLKSNLLEGVFMNFDIITEYLESLRDISIPACEFSLHIDSKEVYRKSFDFYGTERGKSLYWLYSATKIVTATAAMRLLYENKISLDDKVSKYLPYFKEVMIGSKNGRVLPKREITIKDLLSMKSGLNYELSSPWILKAVKESGGEAGTQDIVKAISMQALSFQPGEHFQYSLSHDVLGAVIEVASGKKLSEFYSEKIFEPLHMDSFTFSFGKQQKEKMFSQYIYDNYGKRAVPTVLDNIYVLSKNFESGGAGLIGSVDDYMKLADTLCNNGTSKDGYELLPSEYIDIMTSDGLDEISKKDFDNFNRPGYTYGLGVRVKVQESEDDSPIGEFGWDSAAGAWVMIDRKNKISAFYAQHVLECEPAYNVIHNTLRKLIYKAIK